MATEAEAKAAQEALAAENAALMVEIINDLTAGGVPPEKLGDAVTLGFQIATPAVSATSPNAAFGDGQFLKNVLEFIRQLMPIILQIIKMFS